MSAKRLLGMVVSVVLLASWVSAQINEVSITAGRTFVSTQTMTSPPGQSQPNIHFGNEETVAFNYSRLLKTKGIFGIRAELPVVIYPRMDLQAALNGIPKDIGALFVTPSVRVNFFSADSVTPWVSVGGGYGRFRNAPSLMFFGSNTGASGSNTGVFQGGLGLDVWFWQHWGGRFEARDFYSGNPDLTGIAGQTVTTSNSRQHNYYVGAGVMYRF
jgi:hypothetical protein